MHQAAAQALERQLARTQGTLAQTQGKLTQIQGQLRTLEAGQADWRMQIVGEEKRRWRQQLEELEEKVGSSFGEFFNVSHMKEAKMCIERGQLCVAARTPRTFFFVLQHAHVCACMRI